MIYLTILLSWYMAFQTGIASFDSPDTNLKADCTRQIFVVPCKAKKLEYFRVYGSKENRSLSNYDGSIKAFNLFNIPHVKMPPIHTKTAHFLLANFENGRFGKRNSNRHILETASCEYSKMIKAEHFSTLLERD